MYEIIINKNYRGENIYILTCDGISLGTCNPKNIEKFLSKGYNLNNSEQIEKFIKYNNL